MDILELKYDIYSLIRPGTGKWAALSQSYTLALTLRSKDCDLAPFVSYFDMYEQIIGNEENHVNAVASRILVWAFRQSRRKNWKLQSITNRVAWPVLFVNVDRLIEELRHAKLFYGMMILHESVAHRYADIGVTKWSYHYDFAYHIAILLGRKKNIDSSMYYQWDACVNHGFLDRARECAEKVASNNRRHLIKSHLEKCNECIAWLETAPKA